MYEAGILDIATPPAENDTPLLTEKSFPSETDNSSSSWKEEVLKVLATIESDAYDPRQLIEALKLHPDLHELYSKSVGVREGYTLEEHTLMMMRQRQKYFSEFRSPILDPQLEQLLNALHDIGKPVGVERYGLEGKALKHEFTMEIIPPILEELGYISETSLPTIKAYIDQDFLGDYIKAYMKPSAEPIDPKHLASQLFDRCKALGFSLQDYYDLLKVFYISDAGSYTIDAGGKRGLDHLFHFDQRNNSVEFSESVQSHISKLDDAIAALEPQQKVDQVIPEKLEQSTETVEEDIESLFKKRDIAGLLKNKLPEAQLAAVTLICNHYEMSTIFNPRNEAKLKMLNQLNFDQIGESLSLTNDEVVQMQQQREQLFQLQANLQTVRDEMEQASIMAMIAYDREALQEAELQHKKFLSLERILEKRIHFAYSTMTLPIRRAILKQSFPQVRKLHTIVGIKSYYRGNPEEILLLRDTYATTDDDKIKRQILDTAIFNLAKNSDYLTIAPVDHFEEFGLNADELFLNAMSRPSTTYDRVFTTLAPYFFPGSDPESVAKTWQMLRNISPINQLTPNSTFFSDGYNHDTDLMDRKRFLEIMAHLDALQPVISLLSHYGFQYDSHEPIEGHSNDYLPRLLSLGEDLDQLASDLEAARTLNPDFQYLLRPETRYTPAVDGAEQYLVDNPFVMAFNQKFNNLPYQLSDQESLDELLAFAQRAKELITPRWRAGFLEFFIKELSETSAMKHVPPFVKQALMHEVNSVVLDESLEDEHLKRVATKYFNAAVLPSSNSVKPLFNFLDKHADKVETWHNNKRTLDRNSTWHSFTLHFADLYRYSLDHLDESALKSTIETAQYDFTFTLGAISRMDDISLRDKAIENIVLAYTDATLGDINIAERLRNHVTSEVILARIDQEIALEKERVEKNETTGWKKSEKVARSSRENVEFLLSLYGFTTEEQRRAAEDEWIKKSHTFGPYSGDVKPERIVKLEEELEQVRNSFCVTVNLGWNIVKRLFAEKRLLSMWERMEVAEERTSSMNYDYSWRRDQVERQMGNRSKGGSSDPHPIYGAAFSENGRDEYFGGVGEAWYGACFIKLKSERIKNRTSFVFDDSFDGYTDWMVDWEGGQVFKAIHNTINFNTRHKYVEAQIMNGVGIEDVESVYIPDSVFNQKDEYGNNIGSNIRAEIVELKSQYPEIEFVIVHVPDELRNEK